MNNHNICLPELYYHGMINLLILSDRKNRVKLRVPVFMAFSLGVYLGKMIGCEVMVVYLQDSLLALSSQTVKLCYLFRFFYI